MAEGWRNYDALHNTAKGLEKAMFSGGEALNIWKPSVMVSSGVQYRATGLPVRS